eukprot:1623126-Prymnesium_polylepis.1
MERRQHHLSMTVGGARVTRRALRAHDHGVVLENNKRTAVPNLGDHELPAAASRVDVEDWPPAPAGLAAIVIAQAGVERLEVASAAHASSPTFVAATCAIDACAKQRAALVVGAQSDGAEARAARSAIMT